MPRKSKLKKPRVLLSRPSLQTSEPLIQHMPPDNVALVEAQATTTCGKDTDCAKTASVHERISTRSNVDQIVHNTAGPVDRTAKGRLTSLLDLNVCDTTKLELPHAEECDSVRKATRKRLFSSFKVNDNVDSKQRKSNSLADIASQNADCHVIPKDLPGLCVVTVRLLKDPNLDSSDKTHTVLISDCCDCQVEVSHPSTSSSTSNESETKSKSSISDSSDCHVEMSQPSASSSSSNESQTKSKLKCSDHSDYHVEVSHPSTSSSSSYEIQPKAKLKMSDCSDCHVEVSHSSTSSSSSSDRQPKSNSIISDRSECQVKLSHPSTSSSSSSDSQAKSKSKMESITADRGGTSLLSACESKFSFGESIAESVMSVRRSNYQAVRESVQMSIAEETFGLVEEKSRSLGVRRNKQQFAGGRLPKSSVRNYWQSRNEELFSEVCDASLDSEISMELQNSNHVDNFSHASMWNCGDSPGEDLSENGDITLFSDGVPVKKRDTAKTNEVKKTTSNNRLEFPMLSGYSNSDFSSENSVVINKKLFTSTSISNGPCKNQTTCNNNEKSSSDDIWDTIVNSSLRAFTISAPTINYSDGRLVQMKPHALLSRITVKVSESYITDDQFSGIGKEALKLWKMSKSDIQELQEQVRVEMKHQRSEHIMPLVLTMSEAEIETAYQDTEQLVTESDPFVMDSLIVNETNSLVKGINIVDSLRSNFNDDLLKVSTESVEHCISKTTATYQKLSSSTDDHLLNDPVDLTSDNQSQSSKQVFNIDRVNPILSILDSCLDKQSRTSTDVGVAKKRKSDSHNTKDNSKKRHFISTLCAGVNNLDGKRCNGKLVSTHFDTPGSRQFTKHQPRDTKNFATKSSTTTTSIDILFTPDKPVGSECETSTILQESQLNDESQTHDEIDNKIDVNGSGKEEGMCLLSAVHVITEGNAVKQASREHPFLSCMAGLYTNKEPVGEKLEMPVKDTRDIESKKSSVTLENKSLRAHRHAFDAVAFKVVRRHSGDEKLDQTSSSHFHTEQTADTNCHAEKTVDTNEYGLTNVKYADKQLTGNKSENKSKIYNDTSFPFAYKSSSDKKSPKKTLAFTLNKCKAAATKSLSVCELASDSFSVLKTLIADRSSTTVESVAEKSSGTIMSLTDSCHQLSSVVSSSCSNDSSTVNDLACIDSSADKSSVDKGKFTTTNILLKPGDENSVSSELGADTCSVIKISKNKSSSDRSATGKSSTIRNTVSDHSSSTKKLPSSKSSMVGIPVSSKSSTINISTSNKSSTVDVPASRKSSMVDVLASINSSTVVMSAASKSSTADLSASSKSSTVDVSASSKSSSAKSAAGKSSTVRKSVTDESSKISKSTVDQSSSHKSSNTSKSTASKSSVHRPTSDGSLSVNKTAADKFSIATKSASDESSKIKKSDRSSSSSKSAAGKSSTVNKSALDISSSKCLPAAVRPLANKSDESSTVNNKMIPILSAASESVADNIDVNATSANTLLIKNSSTVVEPMTINLSVVSKSMTESTKTSYANTSLPDKSLTNERSRAHKSSSSNKLSKDKSNNKNVYRTILDKDSKVSDKTNSINRGTVLGEPNHLLHDNSIIKLSHEAHTSDRSQHKSRGTHSRHSSHSSVKCHENASETLNSSKTSSREKSSSVTDKSVSRCTVYVRKSSKVLGNINGLESENKTSSSSEYKVCHSDSGRHHIRDKSGHKSKDHRKKSASKNGERDVSLLTEIKKQPQLQSVSESEVTAGEYICELNNSTADWKSKELTCSTEVDLYDPRNSTLFSLSNDSATLACVQSNEILPSTSKLSIIHDEKNNISQLLGVVQLVEEELLAGECKTDMIENDNALLQVPNSDQDHDQAHVFEHANDTSGNVTKEHACITIAANQALNSYIVELEVVKPSVFSDAELQCAIVDNSDLGESQLVNMMGLDERRDVSKVTDNQTGNIAQSMIAEQVTLVDWADDANNAVTIIEEQYSCVLPVPEPENVCRQNESNTFNKIESMNYELDVHRRAQSPELPSSPRQILMSNDIIRSPSPYEILNDSVGVSMIPSSPCDYEHCCEILEPVCNLKSPCLNVVILHPTHNAEEDTNRSSVSQCSERRLSTSITDASCSIQSPVVPNVRAVSTLFENGTKMLLSPFGQSASNELVELCNVGQTSGCVLSLATSASSLPSSETLIGSMMMCHSPSEYIQSPPLSGEIQSPDQSEDETCDSAVVSDFNRHRPAVIPLSVEEAVKIYPSTHKYHLTEKPLNQCQPVVIPLTVKEAFCQSPTNLIFVKNSTFKEKSGASFSATIFQKFSQSSSSNYPAQIPLDVEVGNNERPLSIPLDAEDCIEELDNDSSLITAINYSDDYEPRTIPLDVCEESSQPRTIPLIVCDQLSQPRIIPLDVCEEGIQTRTIPLDICDKLDQQQAPSLNCCDEGGQLGTISLDFCEKFDQPRTIPLDFCDEGNNTRIIPLDGFDQPRKIPLDVCDEANNWPKTFPLEIEETTASSPLSMNTTERFNAEGIVRFCPVIIPLNTDD